MRMTTTPRVLALTVATALLAALMQVAPSIPAAATDLEWFADRARAMTAHDRTVLWATDAGCPGGEFPVTCAVKAHWADASPSVVGSDGLRERLGVEILGRGGRHRC